MSLWWAGNGGVLNGGGLVEEDSDLIGGESIIKDFDVVNLIVKLIPEAYYPSRGQFFSEVRWMD